MRASADFAAIDRLRASPCLNEACAQHQRGQLFGREHKWRQVELAPQRVADAGLSFNRLSGELQVAHVAIDGALGDLKPLGECAGGLQASGTKHLHDAKETVGAPHAASSLCSV